MVNKTIAIYVFVDELLTMTGHKKNEDIRRRVNDSEILTTAIIAAKYFGGHMENALAFMKGTGLMPDMLGKSRFSRRLAKAGFLLMDIFGQVGTFFKDIVAEKEYILDSFPVAVCHNIRISSCKLLKGEEYRGYKASMRTYFYGVKVQMITTRDGVPIEFCFVPGSEHDVRAFARLPFDLSPESSIYADAAYTDYLTEDVMLDAEGILLEAQRKKNSKRKDHPSVAFLKEQFRKKIETAFSDLKKLFLKTIHAVTIEGFLLKIRLFILAYQLEKAKCI